MDSRIIKKAFDHAQANQWDTARELLKSQESGIAWSEDAPNSAMLQQDGLLVSAALACTEARLFPEDRHFSERAMLLIQELMGDESAEGDRIAKENNQATIARLELGLHPDREEWL